MLQKGQKAAEMVLVDVGADHYINVVQAPAAEILRHGHAAGGAVRKFRGVVAASVDHHDEHAVLPGRVRALQHHGLAVAHVDERQSHLFHRLTQGPA